MSTNRKSFLFYGVLASVFLHGGLYFFTVISGSLWLKDSQINNIVTIQFGDQLAESVKSKSLYNKSLRPINRARKNTSVANFKKPTLQGREVTALPQVEKGGGPGVLTEASVGPEENTGQNSVPGESSVEQVFLSQLKARLERKRRYPEMAKAMRLQGTILVSFMLKKDGAIENIAIVEGKNQILKNAAMELVSSISGDQPIPEKIAKSEWQIQVPIDYKLF